jgi:hypothetical protein
MLPIQEELQAMLASNLIPARNLNFCHSLAKAANPTDKQIYWLHKMVDEYKAKPVDTKQTVCFDAICTLFNSVMRSLKRPEIRIVSDFEAGEVIRIYPAKPSSRNAGSLYIKLRYDYIGMIKPDGTLFLKNDEHQDRIVAAIRKYEQNPSGCAKEYARLTDRCCFCDLQLTDETSVFWGYGKICAKRWQLPYGRFENLASGIVEDIKPDWMPTEQTMPEAYYMAV